MLRRPLLASLVMVAVCSSLSAPAADAQPAPHKAPAQKAPTQKAIDEARKHFQSAEAAKARGEYQTAAVEYLAAYELFEEPAFFYDTAEVYRLAGDEKNALVYYTKYLELAPSGQGGSAARAAADQLRHSIAAKEDAARHAAEQDAEAKRKAEQASEARRKAAQNDVTRPKSDQDPGAKRTAGQPATHTASTPRAHATAGDAADTASPTKPRAGRQMRIAGIATAGAGVVVLGVGAVFGLKARSLSDEASKWDTFDQKTYDEGKADERNMFVLSGVGTAALVAGGVLYYLGHRAEQSTESGLLSITPSIGASQITVTAAGRF